MAKKKKKKLPTAEEFYTQMTTGKIVSEETIMIEFTKLHLEAQREAIRKEIEEGLETFGYSLTDDFKLEQTGNELINNAYPLTNIK